MNLIYTYQVPLIFKIVYTLNIPFPIKHFKTFPLFISSFNSRNTSQFKNCVSMLSMIISNYQGFENTRCARKVMRMMFLITKVFIFSNINVIPFKTVPLGSYTPMLLLVAALQVLDRYRSIHSFGCFIKSLNDIL